MHSFYHIVHFWLREGLSDERRGAFFEALKGLRNSPNVRECRVGIPAHTPRPVVDNSYDAQLFCVFADRAAHDIYQSPQDKLHQDFVDTFNDCWTRVVIYDSIEA